MQFIWSLKRAFLIIFLWGVFNFLLGYALHGKIWELIYHIFGWG
jgi:hypothetical protein